MQNMQFSAVNIQSTLISLANTCFGASNSEHRQRWSMNLAKDRLAQMRSGQCLCGKFTSSKWWTWCVTCPGFSYSA